MGESAKKGILLPPAVGYSLPLLFGLILRNGVSLKYLPRLFLTLIINLINLPFRVYERLLINPRLRKQEINIPPVFIIGHWRSGTTHLHNILCQDPQMGYASTFQSVFPDTMFSWLGRFIFEGFTKLLIPGTRKGDNVTLGTRLPQEEEFALGDKTPLCFYYFWMFPRQIRAYFHQFVRMEGLSEKTKESWRSDYRLLMLKALRNTGKPRFLSKNPPNTGRVEFLLKTFPGARFIHIHRNPVDVFLSTRNFFLKMMPHLELQKIDRERLMEDIFEVYSMLMRDFLEQRSSVPQGQLVEVSYDDLERNPIRVAKRIYESLDLEGFEEATPHFRAYVEKMKSYRKNRHEIDEKTLRRIHEEWAFAFEAWGYDKSSGT